jgi:hypothetical protein
VMMLHREDYYNKHKDDFEPTNTAELIIAKQRNGPTDTVKLTWVGQCMKFKDFTSLSPPAGYQPRPPTPGPSDYTPPSRRPQTRRTEAEDDDIPI